MLLLQKIKNSRSIGYFYTPENSQGHGMIEIHPDTGEVVIVELSLFDKKADYPYYANRAKGYVKQMWDKKELPDERLIAWG